MFARTAGDLGARRSWGGLPGLGNVRVARKHQRGTRLRLARRSGGGRPDRALARLDHAHERLVASIADAGNHRQRGQRHEDQADGDRNPRRHRLGLVLRLSLAMRRRLLRHYLFSFSATADSSISAGPSSVTSVSSSSSSWSYWRSRSRRSCWARSSFSAPT
jgi:hypothetical protein